MASLEQTLSSHLKDAMRARDDVRLRTIRSLRAALKDREIAGRRGGAGALTADDELAVLQKQAKQRQDSIAQFESAGREDLAQREREELAVIESYLPAALSEDEIRSVVQEVVRSSGAEGPADIGKVMGPAMKALRGRADGRMIQQIAREELERRTGAQQ